MLEKVLVVLMLFCYDLSLEASVTREKHHKLLLISFDGIRWDYLSRRPDLDGFTYLKKNGVTAKYLRSVFPTYTSPNHFSIATGLYTESHGVLHNCFYDLDDDVLIPPGFHETLTINEWWDQGGEPIWTTAVNQGLKSGGYLFPGSWATIKGVNATKRVLDTINTPAKEEDWRLRIRETMDWFTNDNLDMVALYFGQPDKDSHEYGPENDFIANFTLPLLSRTIMYLFDQVEKYGLKDNLNVIITSDHGFDTVDTSIKREDAISLATYVNQSYVNFQFNYGPLGLINTSPDDAKYVAEELRNGSEHITVYEKNDIPERLHYKNNKRIPSIVVIAEPGYELYAIFPGFHIHEGQHGYDNKLENMRASYFSIGPSFKKGYEIEGFDSIHIYPLMCHLLNLDPAPNNGSLDVLKNTLEGNTGSKPSQSVLMQIMQFLITIALIRGL